MRPLAVIGNLSRDLVDGAPPRIGGGPYYAARAFRELDRHALVVARCADTDQDELRPALVALGLPVTLLGGTSTATFAFSYEGEVRSMVVQAPGDSWTPAEARRLAAGPLRRVEWLHVAPVLRTDFPAETLSELARGRRLSFDGQGLVRRPETGPLTLDRDFDPELLKPVSILKLAVEEALVLVDALGELADLGVPEVIVTRGSGGSTVFADGRRDEIPAHPLAADPTGAGDAFAAGYLAARSDGLAPTGAARRATALVAALLSP